ncbi:sodium- and chloride-dependent taurine transporter-like isoform X2 [Mercenaria mercenaria]|uniref:sodium- and chloride-dependent taurine transporter-like isoform X2 n=1 Tax=Mercenaria mercenaria TaxID=6596 RepID=UPI00234EAA24|nr:sodium- and chloride-dependent taurine transporter-like isoform X2 [Mercenaria mercenaria]
MELVRDPLLNIQQVTRAFLIPYFILLVTCGVPLFLLELSLGQYMSLGNIEAWGRLVPGFQGIAVASLIIVFCLNLYYIIILSWGVYYLYMSFTTSLPWASCDNEWNSDRCFDGSTNRSEVWSNQSVLSNTLTTMNASVNTSEKMVDSVIEFWERKVLHISDGIDKPGSLVWELAVSLLIVWILIYFCVWKGVRWSGKIVYFTALFPYVILTILLLRGVTLDGAAEGIKFYLKPDFSRLGDPQVWVDGGTQIFFSYAVGFGAMVTLGSYNKYNNNVYKHCFIICSINSLTSLYGGVAVFSVLGFMANQQNVTVAEVAQSGPGLVFITYPKAVTQMPASPVWAIMFFLMILFVGIDSQFVGVEGFLTPVYDMFPHILYKPMNKVIVSGIYCAVSFVIGLCMVTEGGMYVFQLFDYYSASGLVLLWVCFFEAVVIGWVFGADKFVDAVEHMTGHRVSVWFVICWKFILPALSAAIFLFMLIDFTPLKYNNVYDYPDAAHALGILVALISMICIPVVFTFKIVKERGTLKQKWVQVTRPILNAHQIPDTWKIRDTSCVS